MCHGISTIETKWLENNKEFIKTTRIFIFLNYYQKNHEVFEKPSDKYF